MNIYAIYKKINLKQIKDFIKANQEENLHLDFKTIVNADFSTKDDRKNFAKALSGFANSDGGLIIWGVSARKNSVGIDCADKILEIHPISLLMSKLNQLTGELVNPTVEGVVHKKIPTAKDKGIAVTLIPPSGSGPHMAKGGEDRYYKRSGDSFYRMEHFDIEDMFGRRKKPKLSLTTRKVSLASGTKESRFLLILGIKNTGRGPAKSPFLSVRVNPPYVIHKYGIDQWGGIGLKRLTKASDSDEEKYGGSSDIVIYPGIVHDVTAVEVTYDNELPTISDVIINYKIAAEEINFASGRIKITADKLRKIKNFV